MNLVLGEKKNFGFQNLERGKPFLNIEIFISFHIIAMNWIVALSSIVENYNNLLTITCKFIKRIFLVFEMNTWNAIKWIEMIITALVEHDWNISKTIINDRDSKFISEFWIAVFIKIKISLLISIAYHSQTNNQSKHIN